MNDLLYLLIECNLNAYNYFIANDPLVLQIEWHGSNLQNSDFRRSYERPAGDKALKELRKRGKKSCRSCDQIRVMKDALWDIDRD